jgi:hypothetical protein
VYRTVTTGFAFNHELQLFYICGGLIAADADGPNLDLVETVGSKRWKSVDG